MEEEVLQLQGRAKSALLGRRTPSPDTYSTPTVVLKLFFPSIVQYVCTPYDMLFCCLLGKR